MKSKITNQNTNENSRSDQLQYFPKHLNNNNNKHCRKKNRFTNSLYMFHSRLNVRAIVISEIVCTDTCSEEYLIA